MSETKPDIRTIKVVISDSEANLCVVECNLKKDTITKNGIDVHALEAALRAVETAQYYLIETEREGWVE